MITYRKVTFGKRAKLSEHKGIIISLFKSGILVTISYEISRLTLLIDQQFVSLFFDIDTYAKYAFAYNILSCVTTIVMSLSVVMLPKLKRMTKEDALKVFPVNMMVVAVLIAFSLVGYYPVKLIINWMLPAYVDSIIFFQILFRLFVFEINSFAISNIHLICLFSRIIN